MFFEVKNSDQGNTADFSKFRLKPQGSWLSWMKSFNARVFVACCRKLAWYWGQSLSVELASATLKTSFAQQNAVTITWMQWNQGTRRLPITFRTTFERTMTYSNSSKPFRLKTESTKCKEYLKIRPCDYLMLESLCWAFEEERAALNCCCDCYSGVAVLSITVSFELESECG